ncbi:MFS transporter [Roseococcus sp. SYP-B2431]|uniref:MFS transporter n=1 Tax=Roseococcus sp. SYP-B2431 TaxID=2496640 RepID=UPI0013F48851|nr:MFS transporter [Roseococcus sp. SYP-B2431]
MTVAQPAGESGVASLPWHIPIALGFTQTIQWGTLFYSFSILLPPIMRETGWTLDVVVGAFSAALVAEACTAAIVGVLLDRVGARWVMVLGSAVAALGLWLAGQAQAVWQFYAAWILIGATLPAALYQAAFAAVTLSFGAGSARRGMAVVAFAGGLASTVFWPVTAFFVDAIGWRQACTVLAATTLACALPHLLMPGAAAPRSHGSSRSVPEAVSPRPVYVALLLSYATMGLASGIVAVHLVPLLVEKGVGGSAVLLASLLGIAQVGGRLLEFALGARISLGAMTALSLALLGTAFLAFGLGHSPLMLGAALVMFGAANGVLTIMRGALPAHLFGASRYGSISGLLSAVHAIARAFGPLAVAWGREWSGSYTTGMAVVAVLCLLCIPPLRAITRAGRAQA